MRTEEHNNLSAEGGWECLPPVQRHPSSFHTSTYQSCEQHLSSDRWCFRWQLPSLQIARDVVRTFTALSHSAPLSTSGSSGVGVEDAAAPIQIFYLSLLTAARLETGLIRGRRCTSYLFTLVGSQQAVRHLYYRHGVFLNECESRLYWKSDSGVDEPRMPSCIDIYLHTQLFKVRLKSQSVIPCLTQK